MRTPALLCDRFHRFSSYLDRLPGYPNGKAIENAVMEVFDLTPGSMIAQLDLARPIFESTAYHGHFGRTPDESGPGTFTLERADRKAVPQNTDQWASSRKLGHRLQGG